MTGMEDKLDLAIWDMRNHKSPYKDHPASFCEDIPEKLIKKHTKEGDVVFDCFNGSGTTAIKACWLGRQGIGTDVNPKFLEMSKNRWADMTRSVLVMPDYTPEFILDDARKLSTIKDNSVDLIVTSPPYQNLIEYSKSRDRIGRDLGNLNRERYLGGMQDTIKQCGRVLKKGKYCYFIMYDITKKQVFYPSGSDVALMCFEEGSMKLKKIHIILLLALSYFSYAIKCQKI